MSAAATTAQVQANGRAPVHAGTGSGYPSGTQAIPRPLFDPLDFATAPALFAALFFAAGVLAAWRLWWAPGYLLLGTCATAAVTFIAAWTRTHRGIMLLPLATLFFFLGCLGAELQQPVNPQQALAALADGMERPVVGEVARVEPVYQTSYTALFGHKTRQEQAQRIDLRVLAVGAPIPKHGDGADVAPAFTPVQGGLRVTFYASTEARIPVLGCGMRVQAVMPTHTESRYLDPGVWDTSAYLHEQGIGALGTTQFARLSILPGPRRATAACWLHSLQQAASARVMGLAASTAEQRLPAFLRLNEADASMLTAMLTGDRSYLQHGTRVGFERTGSFHLLVVSGMHLAIFASVIFLVTRRLRLPRAASTAITLALAFAYAVFTGYGAPVQRSFWMVTLYLVGRLIFRERHALQAMGVASLTLLAANPRALFGSSLQMTLLSVIAIGGIAAPLAGRTFVPYLRATRNLWLLALDPSLAAKVAQYRVCLRLLSEHLEPVTGRWFARKALPWLLLLGLQAMELLLISVIVEAVMALPMAIYFHRITLLGLPVNFLIVPFLGLLLPAALLTFLVLLLVPAAAIVPAAATAGLLHIVSSIVNFFATMRLGDFRIPAPPAPRIALWIALIALAVWAVRLPPARFGRPRFSFGPALACCALLAAAAVTVAPQAVRHRAGALEVTAIDVGQGDALLVITPDGKSLLVDAGGIAGSNPAASKSTFDIGEEVVSPVLWSRGIERLDAVAITHAHADHIGGMPAVFANFHPRAVWFGNNPLSPEYRALLAEAAALGIPFEQHLAGERWRLGATEVRALAPERDYLPKAEPTNNDSLVLWLGYRRTSALLAGDAEAPEEARMLARAAGEPGMLHADLLKVGHHGSSTSTTPAFLAAVAPAYAAISVGRRNFYGHPRPVTLEDLEAGHAKTYRTDMFGATTFYLDGTKVSAAPWAAERSP